MYNPRFEKEAFKKEVKQNVKHLFRKEIVSGSFLCCEGGDH